MTWLIKTSSALLWDSCSILESCAQPLISETPFNFVFCFKFFFIFKTYFSLTLFCFLQSSQRAPSLSPTPGGARGGPPQWAGLVRRLPERYFFLFYRYSRTIVVPHLGHFFGIAGNPPGMGALLPHLGQTQFPPAPMPTPLPIPRPDPRPPPEPFPAGPVPSLLGITPPIFFVT